MLRHRVAGPVVGVLEDDRAYALSREMAGHRNPNLRIVLIPRRHENDDAVRVLRRADRNHRSLLGASREEGGRTGEGSMSDLESILLRFVRKPGDLKRLRYGLRDRRRDERCLVPPAPHEELEPCGPMRQDRACHPVDRVDHKSRVSIALTSG